MEPSPTRTLVLGIAVAAALALAAAGVALTLRPPLDAPWALAVALSVGAALAHAGRFSLPWRRQRVAASLDEAVVFLALLFLPAPLLPWVFTPAVLVAQVVRGRPLQKSTFNVASHVLGVTCAAGAFTLGSLWLPPVLAATLGTIAFNTTTNTLTAFLFARLERTSAKVVYAERFAVPGVFQAILGSAAGVVLLALWRFNPWSLLAMVPFAYLAREYAAQRARNERVLRAHEGVARLSAGLNRATTYDDVAEAVLTAVGDLVPAASATLVLTGRTWTRPYPNAPARIDPFEGYLVTTDGNIVGSLRVDVDADHRRAEGDTTNAMLSLIAGEAANAAARVRALVVR